MEVALGIIGIISKERIKMRKRKNRMIMRMTRVSRLNIEKSIGSRTEPFIEDSGKVLKDMGLEFRFGLMVRSMKENGGGIKLMEKASSGM